jgi:hypothetical protein
VENPDRLNRRRWSAVRKAQLIAGLLGAIVTIIGVAPIPFLDNLPPHSAASAFFFDLLMYLVTPTMQIGELMHVNDTWIAHSWLSPFIVIAVNTLLCVMLGTVVGVLIRKWQNVKSNSEAS